MRTPCYVFVALATATGAFAQEKTEPSGKFYGPLVTGFWAPQQLGEKPLLPGILPRTVVLLPPTPSRCSVPLLEVPIPKDIHFTMAQIHPRMDQLAPMPQANVPAPPCEVPSPKPLK